jgi:uncharacterized damage-inducible protein DinB
MDRGSASMCIFNTLINPSMDILQLIQHYAAYDLWANTRMIERLSREPEQVLDAHVKSSFPSMRATLMHIRNAEAAWFARLCGMEVKWPAEESSSSDTFMEHVTVMHNYVQSLSLTDLLGIASYKDLKGNVHEQPRWQALMHCFNHSSYHRGQLITMMRQLDLNDVPATDLVVYQRLMKSLAI